MKTQNEQILSYLKRGKPITPLKALRDFGILRLASRIHELKKQGHPIQSGKVERRGKHYCAYWMG